MEIKEPLPLLNFSQDLASAENERKVSNSKSVATYGYTLLLLIWGLFIVTINTLFKCWAWVISPLLAHEETVQLHSQLKSWCEKIDYVVISLWCIYVVAWWWALFSWVGIKLFRHSKGIQT